MNDLIDNLGFMVCVFWGLVVLDILLQGVRKVEYCKGDRVRTKTMGYKGVEWIVISAAPKDKDGQPRYYLRKPGSFTELNFRTDEFDLIARRDSTGHDVRDQDAA